MKIKNSNLSIRIVACFLSFVLLTAMVFPVQATKNTDDLKSELSDLNQDKKDLEKDLDSILRQIKKTAKELETLKEELAIAKGLEEAQYESMMLRIKYMYENGNTTMLELLFSSSCMAEFINRADYFSKITEYDRKLLEEYSENREQITQKEAKLKEEQKFLQSLQDDLSEKEKELTTKISDTSNALTQKLEQAQAEAEKARKEAEEKVEPIVPEKEEPKKEVENSPPPETTTGSSVDATASDVELLAALLECEAGSSNYEALLAVGSVVVNRMKSRYYPDTVEGVIYHSGQFPPAHNGKLDKILERGVKPLCVTAAQDALSGKNNVGDCLQFRAASSNRPGIVIGDNVFF